MPAFRDDLIDLLLSRPGLTQSELAGRLGASTRTVRRHLVALAGDGVAVAEADGRARRYRLAEGAAPHLRVPRLSEDEAEALTIAALAARSVLAPTPFQAPLDRAAAALCRTWIADVFAFEPEAETDHWDFDGAAGGEAPRAAFEALPALVRAVRDRRPVVVTYYTASRRERTAGRRLHPLGVVVRSGSWMLAAWCVQSGRVKDFAIGGIEAVEVRDDETFAPPAGFALERHMRDRFGALSGDAVHEVRLVVEPDALPYFRRKLYAPTQQIESVDADGRALVSFEVEGLEGIAAWVRSWGPRVRVLAPPALAERIAADARATLARYADHAAGEPAGEAVP